MKTPNEKRKQLTRKWTKENGLTYKFLAMKIGLCDAAYLSAMIGAKSKRAMPDGTWARVKKYFGR